MANQCFCLLACLIRFHSTNTNGDSMAFPFCLHNSFSQYEYKLRNARPVFVSGGGRDGGEEWGHGGGGGMERVEAGTVEDGKVAGCVR